MTDHISISMSVMAHPSRAEFFPYLSRCLGDVPFSIDKDNRGVWENCKRAWRQYNRDADYHCVIQDDAILCEGFVEKATEFVKKHHVENEDRAFSFYFGNRSADLDQAKRAMQVGWTVKRVPTWGVAICLPVKLIPEMLEFCDTLYERQDDTRIGKFLKHRDIKVYFPMPSLVDHRIELKSLVGDPGHYRRARFFIDDPKMR